MSGHQDNGGISAGNYIAGFVLAVILTLLSFVPVMRGMLDDWTVSGKIIYLLGLCIIQIIVQIVYFLHLNHGPDAKWNIVTMCFASLCVIVIIGGTWWAIQHLNYNMMGGSGRVIIPAKITQSNPAAAPVHHEEVNGAHSSSYEGHSSHEQIELQAAPEPVSPQTSHSGSSHGHEHSIHSHGINHGNGHHNVH